MNSKRLSDRVSLLVFDTGEELIEGLTRFAEDRGIRGGYFQAIGAFERATVAWWSWDEKQYEEIACDEQVELLSLLGDITSGETIRVHGHAVLGRRGGATLGGHLLRGIVRPTVELILTETEAPIPRQLDPVTRLQLIRLK